MNQVESIESCLDNFVRSDVERLRSNLQNSLDLNKDNLRELELLTEKSSEIINTATPDQIKDILITFEKYQLKISNQMAENQEKLIERIKTECIIIIFRLQFYF